MKEEKDNLERTVCGKENALQENVAQTELDAQKKKNYRICEKKLNDQPSVKRKGQHKRGGGRGQNQTGGLSSCPI